MPTAAAVVRISLPRDAARRQAVWRPPYAEDRWRRTRDTDLASIDVDTHHPLANSIHCTVAIAIQRGNALAIFAGYSRAISKSQQRMAQGLSTTHMLDLRSHTRAARR